MGQPAIGQNQFPPERRNCVRFQRKGGHGNKLIVELDPIGACGTDTSPAA